MVFVTVLSPSFETRDSRFLYLIFNGLVIAMRSFLLIFSLFSSLLSTAQDLVEFENGQVADADDMNSNFQILDERLANMEALTSQLEYSELDGLIGGWQVITIDCSEDAAALSNEEVLKGSDRLRIKLLGTCELDQDFLITGQKLLLDGGELDASGSECATTARIRFPDRGDNQRLNFTLNSSSVLYLKCITLNARDGIRLSAFSNSYIRTEYGVMADNGGISIYAYGNSLFRLFYPKDIAALSIQRGSVGEIFSYDANRLEVDLVEVMTGSNFFCRYCNDPDIDSLTLSGASTAEFYRSSGVLKIGSLDSKQRSTLIFPDNECGNLEIITSNLVSDAKVYQGIDGTLVCD